MIEIAFEKQNFGDRGDFEIISKIKKLGNIDVGKYVEYRLFFYIVSGGIN